MSGVQTKANNVTWSGLRVAIIFAVTLAVTFGAMATAWGRSSAEIAALRREHNELVVRVEVRDEAILELRLQMARIERDVSYIRALLDKERR